MQAYENPKVTILVPCYNVEQFLPQCLDSLATQKLKELQIICINDGSTDNTLSILQDYAAHDERFEIIDKPNSGYGASMNCGLQKARGEYIGIVESDDFADSRMFKRLYNMAKKHDCDLVKCNYAEYENGKIHRLYPFEGYPYKRVFNPGEYRNIIRVLPIIWAGIYRRSMLLENRILFTETPGASYQDTAFVQRVWFAAERVALLPGCFLNYRTDNAASSVKSSSKVYEICKEFTTSEAFLAQRPDKYALFAPVLNSVKMATYRWNFNRIAPEYRLDFCKRWIAELSCAEREGMLPHHIMSELDWAQYAELKADPEAFVEAYPDGLPWG